MRESYKRTEPDQLRTDDRIMQRIRYLDPALRTSEIGERSGSVLGICIALITAMIGVLTYIWIHFRAL